MSTPIVDREGNPISVGDQVKSIEGKYVGCSGVVTGFEDRAQLVKVMFDHPSCVHPYGKFPKNLIGVFAVDLRMDGGL